MQDDSNDQASNPADESPTPIDGSQSPFVSFYKPPRLSIAHLLAWMAAAAVLLSIVASIDRWSDGVVLSNLSETGSGSIGLASLVVELILFAAGIVGLGTIIRDRIRHILGPLQPGHWIVLGQCTGQLLGLVVGLSLWLFVSSTSSVATTGIVILAAKNFIPSLVIGVIYLLAARRCRNEKSWRLTFLMWAFSSIFISILALTFVLKEVVNFGAGGMLVTIFAMGPAMVIPLIGAISFCIAVIRDIQEKNRRDWIHWLGVAMVTIPFIMSMVVGLGHMAINL